MSKRIPSTPSLAAKCSGPIDTLLRPDLFRALGDPTRAKLLSCLAKCSRACSVTEVAECCSVDFSVVSRHLALLERAGVVHAAKEGRTVFYRVEYAKVSQALRQLASALADCCPENRAQSKAPRCCAGESACCNAPRAKAVRRGCC